MTTNKKLIPIVYCENCEVTGPANYIGHWEKRLRDKR